MKKSANLPLLMNLLNDYAQHVQYYNGTDRWEDPKFDYVLNITSEVFLDDAHSPQEWRDQNPVYNNWANCEWNGMSTVQGGVPYTASSSMTTTKTKTLTHTGFVR